MGQRGVGLMIIFAVESNNCENLDGDNDNDVRTGGY